MCEHYIARGICTDFPDWLIAAAGSEASVKIGYDYGRIVTGEKLEIELDLEEEAVLTGGDQEVPNPLEEEFTVAIEVHANFICLFVLVS